MIGRRWCLTIRMRARATDPMGIGVEGAAGDWWGSLVGIPWFGDVIHDPWKLAALGNPDGARLLVMLRDPVARFAVDQVAGAARAAANASFQRGLYADLLLRLWRLCHASRCWCSSRSDASRDAAEELARTVEFLELDVASPPATPRRHPASLRRPLRDDQRRILARAYAPENRRLASLVPDLDLALWEPAA